MPKLAHTGNHFLPSMAHLTCPKVAETALLFCRVTGVSFLPVVVEGVPGPSTPPVFDRLQFSKIL